MKAVSANTLNSGAEVPVGGLDADVRRDLTVTLYNKAGQKVKQYVLKGAWPSEYSIGDFDASSNDVVISTLTVQHHGIIETDLL
jgi:phage tail-like protein